MRFHTKTIFILGLMSTSLFGSTTDYIDIGSLCEKLKTTPAKEVLIEQVNVSTCLESDVSPFDKNYTHVLSVDRVDEESGEIIQESTSMKESDLVKVCEEFEKNSIDEVALKAVSFEIPRVGDKNKDKGQWRVVFTFGPFLAKHEKMDMTLRNDDSNVTIRGLQPIQRTSLHHYKFWSGNTKPGQFVDEPQNKITVELVNDKMFFGLEYSHPKILFQDQYSTPDNNQSVDISGTLAGKSINETGVPLRNYFYQIQASHGNTNINVFAGKIFNLVGKKSDHNLELHLGAGAGVSFAQGVTKYYRTDSNGETSLDITEKDGFKTYGYNIDGKARLRYNFLKGRMNATLTYNGIYTRFDGPLGGFDNVQGNLYSQNIGFTLGARIDDLFKKKKKNSRNR